MSKYIIYLEGNIASGKSTLLPRITNALNEIYKMHIYSYPEPLHIWNEIKKCDKPLLQLLYEHPQQYAPTFQYLTLITRQSQYIEFLEKPGDSIAIIERSYLSDRLFQNVMHSEGYIFKLDMDIFKTAHKPTIKHIHIYIRTNPDLCYERIHLKRKRPEEQNINILYLEKLHKIHDDIFMRDDVICLENNEELTEDKLNDLCITIIQMLND
jgi:deoxyadenosine/deoxycytidine kinase